MALVRWDPARELDSLQSDMNRLFDGFFGSRSGNSSGSPRWIPAMDLVESGEMHEPTSATDLEAELTLTEKRGFVAEALKRLPEKERAAIVLRDIEGLSTREVAGILGSSEVTVRSQISSARVKMKLFLERRLKRQS